MALSGDELYLRLGQVVETMPDFSSMEGPLPAEAHLWLGRAYALVQETGACNGIDAVGFRAAVERFTSAYRRELIQQEIASLLYRALAHAEMTTSAATQGGFLPVGAAFDAFAVIGKVVKSAKTYVRIVDPYLDENALTDFAVLAPEGVLVQLLGSKGDTKPSVKPAYERWVTQYGATRPMEVRLAPPRSLHDRVIDVDGTEAWIITQSLNKLASRSPATLTKATPDVAVLKLPFYASLWEGATPIA